MTRRIVLASASPRRQELLQQLGISAEIIPAELPEIRQGMRVPAALARYLAEEKARRVAEQQVPDGLVIGADTLVYMDFQVLGKPAHADEARAMLRLLSGRTHQVVTAVVVIDRSAGQTAHMQVEHSITDVIFRPWSEEDIEAYVATGEPLDKAGAYAIQGYASVLIEGIRGCYFNVVGLPIALLVQMLRARGLPVRPAPFDP